jgi:hypothetical protein
VSEAVADAEVSIDAAALGAVAAPLFTTQDNPLAVAVAPGPVVERNINEYQTPYQPASKLGTSSGMVPINMAGSTYAALNELESREGAIDDFVAGKLRYSKEQLGAYFSPEQIDALGLAIKAVDGGRGIINADQTGMGKGRFVAGMMRYAKLQGKTPHFVTIKPELFTDIFRDISDIGSLELFKKLFIFNEGVHVMRFGTGNEILHRATTPQDRRLALDNKEIGEVPARGALEFEIPAAHGDFERERDAVLGRVACGVWRVEHLCSHRRSSCEHGRRGVLIGYALERCEQFCHLQQGVPEIGQPDGSAGHTARWW